MASFRALTIQSGVVQQHRDANTLIVGAGITAGPSGALSVGADSGTLGVTLGRAGINVTIAGNLVLTGSTTTVSSTTVDIADRIIHLNYSSGANDPVPSAIAGISINRGTVSGAQRDNAGLIWDESHGRWSFSLITGGDDATVGADQAVKLGALTVSSSLAQSGGGFSLAGGSSASSVTATGAALTLTAGAASTWSTTSGALALAGAGGVNLQTGGPGTTRLAIADSAITVQTGVTLGATGTGNINLPNGSSVQFQIAGASVSANVTAANLSTLTGGGAADGLHTLASIDLTGLITTAIGNGDFCYVSSGGTTPTLSKTDSSTTTAPYSSARCLGANIGTSGALRVQGIVSAAKLTTAGGSPSIGAPLYLAAAADDSGAGAGKLTATAPSSGVLAEVATCLDNSTYSSSKTASVLLQMKHIVVL
jgi:hypothetical protein